MNNNLFGESGIQITLLLILLPIIAGLILGIAKLYNSYINLKKRKELSEFTKKLGDLTPEELANYTKRKEELEYNLPKNALSGVLAASDNKGIISNINTIDNIRVIPEKQSYESQKYISQHLAKLILYFLGCATVWLIVGTSVGEYLGIKFVAPDVDHQSWLSFGRLRPVHTNMVFWGWASLAMVGLAYYVIPRVSNVRIFSLKIGYASLILMNSAVVLGSLALMAGINNSGGEYREYIWPIMLLWAIGVALSLYNYLKTIANRTTGEIYVSNWYIVLQ